MTLDINATQIPGVQTANKIRGFLEFPDGWKYGLGHAPRPETTVAGMRLNDKAASDALETDAFLGEAGEVRVTIYHGSNYLQFTVNDDDGLVEYVRESVGKETDRRPDLSLEEALNILDDFRLELWHSSASFTAPITISAEEFSKTSHSTLPDAEQVFLWLKRTAQSKRALRFVTT